MSESGDVSRTTTLVRKPVHSRSRKGCLTCRIRHSRCDQNRPTCLSCEQRGLLCRYASQSSTRSRRLLPLVPETRADVERPFYSAADGPIATVFDTFHRFGPLGLAHADLFGTVLPRESHSNECFNYLCLTIHDLSRCSDQSSRYSGFLPLASPSSSTAPVRSAISNYTKAISVFRAQLDTLPVRTLLLGTTLFSVIELMKGNMESCVALKSCCLALLARSAGDKPGPPDLIRACDDPAVVDSFSLLLRETALRRLRSGSVHVTQCKTAASTTLVLPCSVPQRRDPMDRFRALWNVVSRQLDSWRLGLYWTIAIGNHINHEHYLRDRDVVIEQLSAWTRAIDGKHPTISRTDQEALLHLRFYCKSTLLSLSTETSTTLNGLLPNDARSLASNPSRIIHGFRLGTWNEVYMDNAILPLLTNSALGRTVESSFAQQTRWALALASAAEQTYLDGERAYDTGFLPLKIRRVMSMAMLQKFGASFRECGEKNAVVVG